MCERIAVLFAWLSLGSTLNRNSSTQAHTQICCPHMWLFRGSSHTVTQGLWKYPEIQLKFKIIIIETKKKVWHGHNCCLLFELQACLQPWKCHCHSHSHDAVWTCSLVPIKLDAMRWHLAEHRFPNISLIPRQLIIQTGCVLILHIHIGGLFVKTNLMWTQTACCIKDVFLKAQKCTRNAKGNPDTQLN